MDDDEADADEGFIVVPARANVAPSDLRDRDVESKVYALSAVCSAWDPKPAWQQKRPILVA